MGYGFEFWLDKVSNKIKGKTLLLSNYYQNPIGAKMVGKKVIANPYIWLDIDFMRKTGFLQLQMLYAQLTIKTAKHFKKMQNI